MSKNGNAWMTTSKVIGVLALVGVVGFVAFEVGRGKPAVASGAPLISQPHNASPTVQPVAQERTAPKFDHVVLVMTCGGGDWQVLVMGCLQGEGGYLKIENAGDVHEYSEGEMGAKFAENESRIVMRKPASFQARVPVNSGFTLRVEVLDPNGRRLGSDEARAGEWIKLD